MRAKYIKCALPSILIMASLIAPAISTISLLSVNPASAQASDPPTGIHLTWGRNDTAHSIVVTWKTGAAEAGDNVLYDTAPRGGDPLLYQYFATGSHHTYTGAGGYIHDVELTGLSPNTVYYFICGGGNGGWSSERSFRTAPETPTSFTFVAGGDGQSSEWSGEDWPRWRDNISRTMAKFNPSFVLFGGDFVNRGDNQAEWDNWFAAMQEYWINNDNLTIPVIPAFGNHEEPGTNYYEQFYLPENESWYSLNWGPDLHIIVLNSETDIGGTQLDWLKQDLAAHASYKWKVALFHVPAYGSEFNEDIRQTWCPVFDNYHVDLVINGHNHYYERTYPIYQNTVTSYPSEGTIYVISGGWGAPLCQGNPYWWTAYGPDPRYHFVAVDVIKDRALRLRAVDVNGNAFDELYIIPFDVTISPSYENGPPKATLTYIVTVTNIGTENDNYDLVVSDNMGWVLTLDDNLLEVRAGDDGRTILKATILENAAPCTMDNITVTATSRADNTVKDNANCIAHVIPPKTDFKLENLYKVRLDANLWLDNGSKLVVKFYKYDNSYQTENVVWENVTPAHVALLENVPHPLGEPVEEVTLVLTGSGEIPVASWTAAKGVLASRYLEIKSEYVKPGADKPALANEYLKIKTQYIKAP